MIKIKLSKNIYMIHSEFFDFLASLYRINNNEKLIQSAASKLKPDKNLQKLIQSIKSKIPEDRNKEIKIFFNYETFYGICLIHEFMNCDNITIEEALNTLEGTSPLKILESFISTGYNLDDEKNAESLVKELINDDKKAVEYINSKVMIPQEYKWDLLNFFINPEDMKKELIGLLRWYYENIYKYILNTVEDKTRKYEKHLVKQSFLEQLNFNSDSKNTTIIAFSYFYEFAQLHSCSYTSDFYLTGLRFIENSSNDKKTIFSNVQMYKSLADETRLSILKLIYKKKSYGKEIAFKLGLSNSTVSYHISMLLLNGFIRQEKSDNKIFYTFNKDNMKKILCNSIDEFFM